MFKKVLFFACVFGLLLAQYEIPLSKYIITSPGPSEVINHDEIYFS